MKLDIKSFIIGIFVFALFAFTSQEVLTYKQAQPKSVVVVECSASSAVSIIKTHVKQGYIVKSFTSGQHNLFDKIFGRDVEQCPYKIGDYLFFDNTLIKINNIAYDKFHGSWISHTPKSFTGGGFGYNAYKDRIRLATEQEVLQAINPYRDGDLIFVKNNSTGNWGLRYTNGVIDKNGNIQCYDGQKTAGNILSWAYHKPAPGVKLPD